MSSVLGLNRCLASPKESLFSAQLAVKIVERFFGIVRRASSLKRISFLRFINGHSALCGQIWAKNL